MDDYRQKSITVSIMGQEDACRKAYLLGYRAGYQDGKSGIDWIVYDTDTVAADPIETMGLSTRGFYCLRAAGCRYVGDVAKLEEGRIRRMRNLGKVTAREIARVINKLGIHGTAWEIYLL